MSMKRTVLALVGLASVVMLSGCESLVGGSSEYGCKGMPDSVTCKSPEEVYKLTDGDDYQQKVSAESKRQLAQKDGDEKKGDAGGDDDSDNSGPSVSRGAPYVPVPAPTANPQPIRTPSEVMRVLVDPYESADGDLNVPGYVYTEIEPRRWEVGASRQSTSIPVIRPMQAPVSTERLSDSSSGSGGNRNSQNTRTMMPNR